MTNEELFKQYDPELLIRLHNAKDLSDHRRMLNKFKEYVGAYPITVELAKGFLSQYTNRKPRTLARYTKMIGGLMKWFGEPLDFKVKVPKSLPEYTEDSDIEKLIAVIENKKTHKGSIVRDLQRWSDRLSGTIILFFSVNLDGTLSHLSSVNRPLRVTQKLGPNTIDPNSLLDNYKGNRISVNGFRMTLKKILRIYRRYIAAVLDIDFVGDKDIEYEVSRDKIAGQGALYVRNSIRSATLRALSEMGILDSMAPETKGLITDLMQVETPWNRDRDIQHDIEPDILDKVAQLIPKGRWPPMLDKKIARELNISNTLAARAIHRLIIRGTIQKPVAWHPKNSTNTQSNTTSQNSSNN